MNTQYYTLTIFGILTPILMLFALRGFLRWAWFSHWPSFGAFTTHINILGTVKDVERRSFEQTMVTFDGCEHLKICIEHEDGDFDASVSPIHHRPPRFRMCVDSDRKFRVQLEGTEKTWPVRTVFDSRNNTYPVTAGTTYFHQ